MIGRRNRAKREASKRALEFIIQERMKKRKVVNDERDDVILYDEKEALKGASTVTIEKEPDDSEDITVEKDGDEVDDSGEYNDEEGMPVEYFAMDQKPLRDSLVASLIEQGIYPEEEKSTLEQAVAAALIDARTLTNEYCAAVPADEKWKIGLSKKEVEKLETVLVPIRDALKEETPTLAKILTANIPFDRKKTAVKYFDVLNNQEPYTFDYYRVQTMINCLLESGKDSTPEDVEMQEKALKELKKRREEQLVTPKRLLQTPRLSSEDRLRLYKQWDVLEHTDRSTDSYFAIEEGINQTLLLSKDVTDEQATTIEDTEKRLKASMKSTDLAALKRRIIQLTASDTVKTRLYEMYNRLSFLRSDSSEYSTLLEKINFALQLPYQRSIAIEKERHLKDAPQEEVAEYLYQVHQKLDAKLYGMTEIKEKLIEALNNRICKGHSTSQLALEGLPGTGKTAIGKALAEAVGRPFEKISLGGMTDASLFKGDRTVWTGSAPSIILQILKKMQYNDGVVLIDELDKLCESPRGAEVQFALLHIADYVHNKEFEDTYLQEFTHDISNIWWIYAMNSSTKLDSALIDRLDILVVKPYTHQELGIIFTSYVLPVALQAVSLQPNDYVIDKNVAKAIMNRSDLNFKDKGARVLEKVAQSFASRLNMLRKTTDRSGKTGRLKLSYQTRAPLSKPIVIDENLVTDLLRNKDFNRQEGWRGMYA